MKRAFIICGGLVVLLLGAGIGYHYGKRKGHNDAIEEEWMDSMERAQLNGEYEARAYLRCVQDIDSGNVSNLHRFATTHLRVYVSGVQDERQQGHTWAPHIPSLYSNATAYLAQHPQTK